MARFPDFSTQALRQMTRLASEWYAWHFSPNCNTDISNQSLRPNEAQDLLCSMLHSYLNWNPFVCLSHPGTGLPGDAVGDTQMGGVPHILQASLLICLELITFDFAFMLFWKMLCPCPGDELHIGGPVYLRTETKRSGGSSGAHTQGFSNTPTNKRLRGDLCPRL